MKYPCSAYTEVFGIVYVARMLDKIRLYAAGELPVAYHTNLGVGLFDEYCCNLLEVTYLAVSEHAKKESDNEKVLKWCFENGKKPTAEEVLIWNAFMTKKGFRDDYSEKLNKFKVELGLAHRDEIQTLFDFYEFDEERAK
jgi:gluconokinase